MRKTIRKFKNTAHLLLAALANSLYAFPSRNMVVIGVTGTDGKTTTSSLIYHILEEAGQKVALVSTLGAIIDGKDYETGFHVTTPSAFALQKYIKIAKEKGCTHIILEVTSHALNQNRVFGIKFNIGVLTNITHEHFDYHKTYKNYVYEKIKLLKNSKLAIVNSNGDWFPYIQKEIPDEKLKTYSLNGKLKSDTSLQTLPFKIKTKLTGDFNLENIIAGILVSIELGIKPSVIDMAIQSFEAPVGRGQIIEAKNIGRVMIDFAHTPNSFENVLKDIKGKTTGKLIHVFSCAGERDKSKRPLMGKVASKYDDIMVLTSEDPRGESVAKINEEILSGIDKKDSLEIHQIPDRKDAIFYALSLAKDKDTVVITGKGHERYMNYGHGEIPWSDEKVVREFLSKI